MKLIASWGTSGAGKTTIAQAIAAELVHRHQDVLVIGADSNRNTRNDNSWNYGRLEDFLFFI